MLPIRLWIEIRPFCGIGPMEFLTNKSYTGDSLNVRRWSFIKVQDLPEVHFNEIVLGSSVIKIAKIGDEHFDFPQAKCWWLQKNTVRMDEIAQIEQFRESLSPFYFPPLGEMKEVLIDG